MAHGNQELIDALRDLAATCRDAEEGYNKAAKGVHSDDSRRIFNQLSKERAGFAREIDEHLKQLGGDSGEQGHGGGVLRRGWVDLEQNVRPKEDSAIIEHCADGDMGGLTHYERAMALPFGDDVKATLRRHVAKIGAAVDQLRSVAPRR